MSASDERPPDAGSGPVPASDDRPGGSAPPGPDDAAPEGPVCDLCGAPMYEWHCRILCPRCGYQRDCSDP